MMRYKCVLFKKAILVTIVLIPLVTSAQSNFSITGTGSAFNNGDKIFLVYKVDGKVIADSTVVVNNAFRLKGTITGVAPGSLYKNQNPMFLEYVHDEATLYIEPGNIKVVAIDSLATADISGTTNNVDNIILKKAITPIELKRWKLTTEFEALTPEQQHDISLVAEFRRKRKLLYQEMEPIEFAFIRNHPNSYVSLVAVSTLKVDDAPIKKIAGAYAQLSPKLKSTTLGKSLGISLAGQIKSDIGEMAMDFMQPDIQGRPVKLSDLKGKYVLVDFWASWCGPCRAENPFVVTAYNKFKDKGFTVLSISLDDKNTKAAWLKAIKDDGLTWTQVSDLRGNKLNEVARLYGVTFIPANFLVDPKGKIVAKNIKDQTLLNKLDELLGQQ